MVMFDNEFETKENEVLTKNKIEPQHIGVCYWSKLNFGLYFNIGWFSIFFCLDKPYNIHESGLEDKRNWEINHLPRLKNLHLNL